MVNIEERNRFIQLANDYLDGKMDESEFFGKMGDFEESHDFTISRIAGDSFGLDIGPENSDATPTKEDWDYFQRLLLVLSSGSEFEDYYESANPYNSGTFLISITSIILYFICVFEYHFSWILCNIAISLILLPLAKLANFETDMAIKRTDCYPFNNLGEIRKAVRLSGNFRKRKFRGDADDRKENNKTLSILGTAFGYAILILLAPIFMFFNSQFQYKIPRLKFPAPETSCR